MGSVLRSGGILILVAEMTSASSKFGACRDCIRKSCSIHLVSCKSSCAQQGDCHQVPGFSGKHYGRFQHENDAFNCCCISIWLIKSTRTAVRSWRQDPVFPQHKTKSGRMVIWSITTFAKATWQLIPAIKCLKLSKTGRLTTPNSNSRGFLYIILIILESFGFKPNMSGFDCFQSLAWPPSQVAKSAMAVPNRPSTQQLTQKKLHLRQSDA